MLGMCVCLQCAVVIYQDVNHPQTGCKVHSKKQTKQNKKHTKITQIAIGNGIQSAEAQQMKQLHGERKIQHESFS